MLASQSMSSIIVGTPADRNSSQCIWPSCHILNIFAEKFDLSFVFKSSKDVDDAEFLIGFFAKPPENYTNLLPFTYYSSGCILPNLAETVKSKFFILPFEPSLWATIMVGVLYFATVNSIVSHIFKGSRNWLTHLLDMFSVTICAKGFDANTSHLLNGIHFLMIWHGIILTNLYCTFLGSYILAPLSKSVDTVIYNIDNKPILEAYHQSIFRNKFKVVGYPSDFYLGHFINANMSFGCGTITSEEEKVHI